MNQAIENLLSQPFSGSAQAIILDPNHQGLVKDIKRHTLIDQSIFHRVIATQLTYSHFNQNAYSLLLTDFHLQQAIQTWKDVIKAEAQKTIKTKKLQEGLSLFLLELYIQTLTAPSIVELKSNRSL